MVTMVYYLLMSGLANSVVGDWAGPVFIYLLFLVFDKVRSSRRDM